MLRVRTVDGGFVERTEDAWPIPRTRWTRRYLDAATASLVGARARPEPASSFEALASDGMTFSTPAFEAETEITGPVSAKLFVSSTTTDADLFLVLRVFAPDGRGGRLPGRRRPAHAGGARMAARLAPHARSGALDTEYRPFHPHDESSRSRPASIVELDVEIWPTASSCPRGYRLALTVRGRDYECPGARRAGVQPLQGEQDARRRHLHPHRSASPPAGPPTPARRPSTPAPTTLVAAPARHPRGRRCRRPGLTATPRRGPRRHADRVGRPDRDGRRRRPARGRVPARRRRAGTRRWSPTGRTGRVCSSRTGYPDAWNAMLVEAPRRGGGLVDRYQAWEVCDPENGCRTATRASASTRAAGAVRRATSSRTRRAGPKDFHDCIEWAAAQPWSYGQGRAARDLATTRSRSGSWRGRSRRTSRRWCRGRA